MIRETNPQEIKLKSKPQPPEMEQKTDAFGGEEQKKIVTMVLRDMRAAEENERGGWVTQAAKDIQHYNAEKPSILEGLNKSPWMSDRNLGLCPAVCDTYQAAILQTCWNPSTIHFVPTQVEKSNNKQNLERFAKWMVGDQEMKFFPEIDDFIQNRINLGFSVAYVGWKVWYEWVDERELDVERNTYTVKTVKKRFERGELLNIADPMDVKFVDHGNDIQDLPFIIHILHKYVKDVVDAQKRGVYTNATDEFIEKMKVASRKKSEIKVERLHDLGEKAIEDLDIENFPVDLYVWYGWYEKDGRREKWRFIIEPQTETFLSGKPVRRITRRGQYPFVGGPLIRVPGHIRGKSIPHLIAPIVNAFNNVFNQKSDFQYVTNCPFGFYNPAQSEGYMAEKFELTPMTLYPVDGKPTDNAYVPNLGRSMAWAMEDIQVLFDLLERLTGAASFFMSNRQGVSATATRDVLINEKSETRFGKWIMRISSDVTKIINMAVGLYQDWAPPLLGDRILNDEGQQVIRNFSIAAIYGEYDARMQPDFINGSKSLAKEVALWGFQNLSQTLWLDPRINPSGNWRLAADTAKKIMGIDDPERYLGREPKDPNSFSMMVEEEWGRFMDGEDFDPIEGEDPVAHYEGHMRQKEEKYYDLDKEYRPIFDKHLTKTVINFINYLKQVQEQRMANAMTMGAVGQGMGMAGQPGPAAPTASGGEVLGEQPPVTAPMLGGGGGL